MNNKFKFLGGGKMCGKSTMLLHFEKWAKQNKWAVLRFNCNDKTNKQRNINKHKQTKNKHKQT